ncbi:two-component sensor histidine kinase [Flavobacteriaceae bacterium F89]|uniref:histidine kinase n=1 Tax=Cerina litoralis TaxID=2874477 RepID=A0AAE3ETX5_9FLAO|nr:ATP-binding protein [Cerina litoralis]MCG2459547.1 two-component sensor histidine kinase [Cerina litoralis]
MKKRRIYIIVFVVSVLGLAVIQYKYLSIGLNLAKVQFNQKIALTSQELKKELRNKDELTFLIGKAITNDDTYFKLSLDSVQDASKYFLNDFITEKLVNNGIDTDFSFRIFSKDSTYYLTAPVVFANDENLIKYPLELEGYLPELLHTRVILELQFKDINTYFLSQLNGLTIPSLIFLTAIIVVVIWVLRSFYWQRRLITTTNEFINNLTHELKTPVFSIGLATKMLEADAPIENKPILGIIRQETERLKKHIDKVLELGSMETRKKVFDLYELDFKPYLQKLCEEFLLMAPLEKLEFSYNLDSGKYPIKADVFHLENAINNLLDNAKKYSGNPIISLTGKTKKDLLHIEVSDNGHGISEKDQMRIFQKYYRVSNGDLHKVAGYGLGLSYVKKVVQGHKGKINLVSKVGQGTTISIIIPLIKHGR